MKAISLKPRTTNIQIIDVPDPKITKDSEIKAKVLFVGICGTDREEAAGGRADAPKGESALIIGHEMLGEVIEVGKKVTKVKVGDRVVFTVRRGCNECVPCQSFRSDYCLTGNYTERGIKGAHGFQSTFVVDDEMYAIKVPSQIGNTAVLAEPMSVVQKAIQETLHLQSARMPWLKDPLNWVKDKTVCVAGLGPIGLLASIVLRLKGANVIGLDRSPPDSLKAKLLQKMGGTYYPDRDFDMNAFHQKYPDIQMILDAAGVAKFDFNLIELLGINGVLVLTGVPAEKPQFPVDGSKLMRQLVLKNQIVLGSVNESIHHFEDGLNDLTEASQKWPGLIEQIITDTFPYSDFAQAFANKNPNEIKAVIQWNTIS